MKKLTQKRHSYNKKQRIVEYFKSQRLASIIKRRKKTRKKRINKYDLHLALIKKTIIAPENFGLTNEEDRDQLLLFLKKIDHCLKSGHKVNISFERTKSLMPCGTLWATTKLENLINQYPNQITSNYPSDNIVEQLFQHIGLLEKLGKRHRKKEINAENVKHWHYVSGLSTDDVKLFKNLLQSISLEEDTRSGLFDSMSEAVTNTIQHAYPTTSIKEWRMFAQVKDNRLTVAICDQGVGIPGSLRKKPELKEWFASPIHHAQKRYDTFLIKTAVESSRTQTKLPYRGKGLRDMLDLVKNGTVGGFLVLSAKGAFNYNAVSSIQTSLDYKTSINGTIIEWQISLGTDHEQ